MRTLSLLLAFALVSVVRAASRNCTHKIKESIEPPRGWVKQSRPPADSIIELRIALPQSNFTELERHLYEVSDPSHPRYGAHLTKEEVEALVAPHPDSLALVNEWLDSHGMDTAALSRSPAQDWVKMNLPVHLAEDMLDTEYHFWVHEGSGKTALRTTSFSLPDFVHSHVEVIHPTTYFPSTRKMATTYLLDDDIFSLDQVVDASPIAVPTASGGQVDADCTNNITISCLQQLYNAVGFTPSANNGNHIALTGYLEEFANNQDLQSFYAQQRPDALNSTFTFISVKGGLNNQSQPGGEANLDTQFAFGLTFPTPGTFYSTAGRPPIDFDARTTSNTNEPYQDWLDFVLNQPNPPQTISTSYGDDEQTVPETYARRVCAGFAQLGARGVSLVFSSGDFGVGDGDSNPNTQQCFTNDGRNVTRFIPVFPATCPFVTSVGGTFHVPETAIDFSGGGFSNYFTRPLYQELAVPEFLEKQPKGLYQGLFNPIGRGFPDVSAQSNRFIVFIGGRAAHIGGTSAAAPTVAGIVSLLNDARLSRRLPPLGFLNPLIYANTHALNDITSGNNPGCGTPGFNATTGWDPISGLGTPNFGKLKDVVLDFFPFGEELKFDGVL